MLVIKYYLFRTEDSLPRTNNPAGSSGSAMDCEVAMPSAEEMEPPRPSTSSSNTAQTPTASSSAPAPSTPSRPSRIARATPSRREIEPSTSGNRPQQASQLRRQMYFESIEAWRNISETAESMRPARSTITTEQRSPYATRFVEFMKTALTTLPENSQERFLNDLLELYLKYRRESE